MSANLKEIWNKVMQLLEEEMTSVSFSTWIEPIVPVSCNDNCVVLEVPSEFNFGIIKSRYKDLIQNAFRIVTHKNLEIELCVKSSENASIVNNKKNTEDTQISSILNPKYTFSTFVKGSGNQLAHAAALAVAEAPALRITLCLYTEE